MKNHVKTQKLKNKFHITSGDFPAIMGFYPGLSIINHPYDNCSQNGCTGCISKLAYEKIFLKFKENNEKKDKNTMHQYFMFNWTGDLSGNARSIAAEELTESIINLSQMYPHLIFNFYGHSHGGNVIISALQQRQNLNINIGNIVLLGTPIGRNTPSLVENIGCTYLFNVYSNDDTAQNKDITFDTLAFW